MEEAKKGRKAGRRGGALEDLLQAGARLGFEDIAALLDLRVGGALSTRKYKGLHRKAWRFRKEEARGVCERGLSQSDRCCSTGLGSIWSCGRHSTAVSSRLRRRTRGPVCRVESRGGIQSQARRNDAEHALTKVSLMMGMWQAPSDVAAESGSGLCARPHYGACECPQFPGQMAAQGWSVAREVRCQRGRRQTCSD